MLSGQHLQTLSLSYWIKKDWDASQSEIKQYIGYLISSFFNQIVFARIGKNNHIVNFVRYCIILYMKNISVRLLCLAGINLKMCITRTRNNDIINSIRW